MPADKCDKERAAFIKASQTVADAEVAYYIAQNNLEAAIWGIGAADIKIVKESAAAVRGGSAALSNSVIAIAEAASTSNAATARLKAANAGFAVAQRKRDQAKQEFDKAQADLDKCVEKIKQPRWIGSFGESSTTPDIKGSQKGATITQHDELKRTATVNYTIVAPKIGLNKNAYIVHYVATVDWLDRRWGVVKKEYVGELVGTESITIHRVRASGVTEADITYDAKDGLSVFIDQPTLSDGMVVTSRVISPVKPTIFSTSKIPYFVQTVDLTGKKMKGSAIKGTNSKKYTGYPPYEQKTWWALQLIKE